jgi:hypothetical protein
LLEMFISIMFSKGMYALEHNEDYMEVKWIKSKKS